MIKEVILVSNSENGEYQITVSIDLARNSKTIAGMLEDMELEENQQTVGPIPLPNIDGPSLKKIVRFLQHDSDEPRIVSSSINPEERHMIPIGEWNTNFFKEMSVEEIYNMILAANYLDIPVLLETVLKWEALQLKPLTVEQIKQRFNFNRDFTPEEIAKAEQEHPWMVTNAVRSSTATAAVN